MFPTKKNSYFLGFLCPIMSHDVPRVTLEGPIDLALPDGSAVRVRPGPYGKGLAVVQIREHSHDVGLDGEGRPGRKPRASTVRLRLKLRQDKANGGLRNNPHYVGWLMEQDSEVGLAVARQTVYRERKRLP